MMKNKKGYTLVELVVVFALIGIFMTAAIAAITSFTRVYSRVESVSRTQTVSDTLVQRIISEIGSAKKVNDIACVEISDDRESVTFRNEKGIPLTVKVNEEGYLVLEYSKTNTRADIGEASTVTWFYGQESYMGTVITNIQFVPIKKNIIRLTLELTHTKTGYSYTAERVFPCYNLASGDVIIKPPVLPYVYVRFVDGRKIAKSVKVEPGNQVSAEHGNDVAMKLPSGMIFSGKWYVKSGTETYVMEDEGRTPYDFSEPVTRTLTLVPGVENRCLVQFVTDTNAIEPQVLNVGDKVIKPATEPERVGYIFGGWSLTKDGEKYDFDTPVTHDLILYAVWTPDTVKYTVQYWLEKENLSFEVMETQKDDIRHYEQICAEERTGLSGTVISATQEYLPVSAANQLALHYTQNKKLPSGSSFSSGPQAAPFVEYYKTTTTTIKGDGSTVVDVFYTRKIYNLDVVVTNPGDKAATIKMPNGDVASATANYTFKLQGKLGYDLSEVAPDIAKINGDGEAEKAFIVYDKNGVELKDARYILRGWGTWSVNLSSVLDEAKMTVWTGKEYAYSYTPETSTLTYRASWAPSNSTQHMTQYFRYVESLDQSSQYSTDPAGDPERIKIETLLQSNKTGTIAIDNGYEIFEKQFSSPYYWASGGDRQLTNPIEGFAIYGAGSDSVNCYQWDTALMKFYQLRSQNGNVNEPQRFFFFKRLSYTLSFNLAGNGSTVNTAPIKYEAPLADYESEAEAAIAALVADGRINEGDFLGWYKDSDYTEPFAFSATTMPASNVTIYAKFKPAADKVCQVKFLDAKGGTELTAYAQDILRGTTVAEPNEYTIGTTYNGKVFSGWAWTQNDSQGTAIDIIFNFNTPLYQNTTIFATWDEPGYTVTYDLDGGKDADGEVVAAPVDLNVYMGDTEVEITLEYSFSKAGKLFTGWKIENTDDPDKTEELYGDEIYERGRYFTIKSNVKLVAQYED